jgi:hypothetical protein
MNVHLRIVDEDGDILFERQGEYRQTLAAAWESVKTDVGPLSVAPSNLADLCDALAYAECDLLVDIKG